jgi:peptide/nickel transport system permease protein
MARYLMIRVGQLIFILFLVTLLAFIALNLLGDPLNNLFGPALEDPDFAADVEAARDEWHLDDPLPVRYVRWLGDVVTGDFGRSFASRLEVSTVLAQRLPKTLLLMLEAQVLALVLAVPWAVFSASRAYTRVDKTSTAISFGFIAIPNFALGVILLWLLVIQLGWFELTYDDTNLWTRLVSLFPGALTLAIGLAGAYQRLLRTDMVATLQEDFVLMAKAKGMSNQRILWRHALRPSLFSLITVFGINTGALIGGSLVVERIFNIPGLGNELAESVIRNDYPIVLAGVLVVATGFVVINVMVDVLYSFLDPRIRDD